MDLAQNVSLRSRLSISAEYDVGCTFMAELLLIFREINGNT